MFEEWISQIPNIASITIGGVSIVTIISLAIAFIRQIVSLRKERTAVKQEMIVTKQQIEDSFKNAIFPKNIKLDVSKKIEGPIKDGLAKIEATVKDELQDAFKGQRLILAVLSQFSHVQKLPEATQEAIKDYLDKGATEEVEL